MPLVEPRFEVRAKVRVGERQMRGGKELPTSLDYFVSDDPEFNEVIGPEPRELRIALPYETAGQCFVETLENWNRSVLFCRSNDGKVAIRRTSDGRTMDLDAPPMTIDCPHRNCEFYRVQNGCKETGRLRFFLEAGTNRSAVLSFETHGYGSLEGIAAAIRLGGRLGDLTLATGTLRVTMESKERKRFPVVRLELDAARASDVDEIDEVKAILREIGEYDNPAYRRWIEKVGASAALERLRSHPDRVPL
jgi:Recombination directionality factor-like